MDKGNKKMVEKSKKWMPVSGETFYFIYKSDRSYPSDGKDFVSLNFDNDCLVIGDAECYSPEFDTTSNCFRTKTQAKRALRKIHEALKFTGE